MEPHSYKHARIHICMHAYNSVSILFKDLWSLDTSPPVATRGSVHMEECLISHNIISFGPKKLQEICSCQLPGKYFPVFTLDTHWTCLDWPYIAILTSQPIYNPFKSACKWRQKWQIWLWCQFHHWTSNHKIVWNAFLDTLICSLQITNWH